MNRTRIDRKITQIMPAPQGLQVRWSDEGADGGEFSRPVVALALVEETEDLLDDKERVIQTSRRTAVCSMSICSDTHEIGIDDGDNLIGVTFDEPK